MTNTLPKNESTLHIGGGKEWEACKTHCFADPQKILGETTVGLGKGNDINISV